MNIEKLVEQYRNALYAEPEGYTENEITEFRGACENIKRFMEDKALQTPIGYMAIESVSVLVDGGGHIEPEITPCPDAEVPPHPTLPVYLLNPVDVMAHTLAQIILQTEEEGPLSADDLRAIYQFMIPGEGEAS